MPVSANRVQEAVADALALAYGKSRIEVKPNGDAIVAGLTGDVERLITTVPRHPDFEDKDNGTPVHWLGEDDGQRHEGTIVSFNAETDEYTIVTSVGDVVHRWSGLDTFPS